MNTGVRKTCMVCSLMVLLLLTAATGAADHTDKGDIKNTIMISQQDTLDVENVEKAKEKVRGSVTGILLPARIPASDAAGGSHAEGSFASGVIWDADEDGIIIAASRHLLELGNTFWIYTAGTDTLIPAVPLGASVQWDVGFIRVSGEALLAAYGKNPSAGLKFVRLHQRLYDSLNETDTLFAAGTSYGETDLVYSDGTLLEKARYMEEFGSDMLELKLSVRPGMSGGGIFDAYGNFVGLISGGSTNQSAAVSMEDVNRAYLEVCGRCRDTQEYDTP